MMTLKKLKAGALYFAIIIALVIALITSSLIIVAAHFKTYYLKERRFSRLVRNLNSGIVLLLHNDNDFKEGTSIDLFQDEQDSVYLQKKEWGAFELGTVKAHILGDTVSKSFLIGLSMDADHEVIYLSDEDRPLSVTGTTRLIGDGRIPKSGLKKGYVDGKAYSGDERMLIGRKFNSDRNLPGLDIEFLKNMWKRLAANGTQFDMLKSISMNVSFQDSTRIVKVPYDTEVGGDLRGNIILFSDSTITISSSARLDKIQIYAKSVKIRDGFEGVCQIFATDSISIGAGVRFGYPSVIGISRTPESIEQPRITFGNDGEFHGLIFSYEEARTPRQMLVDFGKGSRLFGELYVTGMLKFDPGFFVAGKVACNRFVMQTPSTMYENFLIDVVFDRKALSKYYLSSPLLRLTRSNKEIMAWVK